MDFDNAIRNMAFTSVASDTDLAITVQQIRASFIRKFDLLPIDMSVYDKTIVGADADGFVQGESCTNEFLHTIHAAAGRNKLLE